MTLATVTSAGAITGVSIGDVTISVDYQGFKASKKVRVLPNYGGVFVDPTGTDGDNPLFGNDGANRLVGLGGNDQLIGGAGADLGKLILSSAADFTLAGGGANLTAASYATNLSNGSLATVDVKTVTSANTAINAVDSALARVSTLRSTFGAVQNRFDSVISSLSSTSENLSAARSRIVDTDFASETANLTRNQILQQAGTAMLAQANALPQSVLSLLK